MTRRSSSAYLMNGLTHDRIEELREHFHIFDLNGSGWIEKDDLQQALAILGQPSDDDEVNKLLTAYDTNLDGRVSFDEYIAWNRQLFVDEMTTKFNEMDEDGSGTLDKVELKKIALELGFGVTEEELDDLTYEMDINQDGNIDVEEFILAMVRARIVCTPVTSTRIPIRSCFVRCYCQCVLTQKMRFNATGKSSGRSCLLLCQRGAISEKAGRRF